MKLHSCTALVNTTASTDQGIDSYLLYNYSVPAVRVGAEKGVIAAEPGYFSHFGAQNEDDEGPVKVPIGGRNGGWLAVPLQGGGRVVLSEPGVKLGGVGLQ
ncbi:hypothetical protein TWF225_009695 [Orbilia oligospora]|nr:hypothetical protein TWF225_009695 [Orbilia oligospora]KAF3244330.1 hypothetical protein TWF128_009722 [Orbilia oligospora]KAF3247074.1 hypothetical protein TWF217_009730 [Orbilia oligospora]